VTNFEKYGVTGLKILAFQPKFILKKYQNHLKTTVYRMK